MEIFVVVLPTLHRASPSAEALIAGFERRRLTRLSACSSCAGDYEDPDRTAGSDEAAGGDDDSDQPSPQNELPAPRG